MSRVGFILKAESAEAAQVLDQLVPWLVAQGHRPVFVAEDAVAHPKATLVPEQDLANNIELAVVLGGDGTMLRAAGLVADAGIPILGINLGRLGFLTPFDPDVALDALARALSGELQVSERMRLQVTYRPKEGPPVVRYAVNDAIVHQGAMARLVELEARLDGNLIASYRADGLIVATPTGSTAYNLAAGGPILVPHQEAVVITPICAHTLTNRPLVVDERNVLSVRIADVSRSVVITVDGLWAHTFQPGDDIEITRGPTPLKIFVSETPYFDILRQKLHWAAETIGRPKGDS